MTFWFRVGTYNFDYQRDTLSRTSYIIHIGFFFSSSVLDSYRKEKPPSTFGTF